MAVPLFGPVKSTRLGTVKNIAYARGLGGLNINARRSDPYWAGSITTPNISIIDRKGWLAWLDDCVDRNLRVDLVHPQYRYPDGYSEDTWPLVTDPLLVSVTDRRTIVVSGLELGMVLPAGTRLTLIQGDVTCYRRLREAVTVTSETAQTLPIGPRLPAGVFVAGAAVRFALPFCRVVIVPDSWEADEDIAPLSLTFEVSEVA